MVTNDEISSQLKSKKAQDEKQLTNKLNDSKVENPVTTLGNDDGVFCTECGTKNLKYSKYCSNCGNLIKEQSKDNLNNQSIEEGRKSWINKVVTYAAIWGVLNLLIASPLFGGTLIFFAILIYASKSFKAIYAFGIIWLLLALLQLVLGAYYAGYESISGQGYLLILFAFINFGFGGWIIYKTKEAESK